jgi:hypothetical protein
MPMSDMLGGSPKGRGNGTSVSGGSMVDFIKRAWNANPLESARAYLNSPDPEGYQRANVLPYATNAAGEVEWAVPSMGREIAREGLAGLESANRVRKGEVTPEQGAFDAALATFGMGAVGGRYVPKGALTMNVFQGGPHKYGPEGAAKSLDHISTGEGAQAYGWGRYDAGSPAVAKEYQARVPAQDAKRTFLDALPEDAGIEDVEDLLGRGHFSESQETVLRALAADDWLGFDYPAQAISAAYSKNLDNWDPSPALRQAVDGSGNIYKHDLPDEDIARYLDWDKPLSEQPESVRAALEPSGFKADPQGLRDYDKALLDALYNDPKRALPKLPADPTGAEIYQSLVDKSGALDWPVGSDRAAREAYRKSAKQAASEALGEAGIPGLQYYDGMSRYADGGANAKGTAIRILDAAGGDYDKAVEIAKARRARRATGNMDPNDPKSNLSQAIDMLENKFDDGRTRNYVTWDQDVLDRMTLLERNGEDMTQALMPDALPMDEASRMAKRDRIAALRAEANANRAGESVDDYAGIHRPPMRDSGAPAHDLTGGGTVYPDDVYSPNAVQYYGTGNPAMDQETVEILNSLKGNPDEMVSIYRAVPSDASGAEISAGDWVTVNRNYAIDHGEGTLRGDYSIIERKVPARDIYTNGDSIHEFGFDPAKADSADILAMGGSQEAYAMSNMLGGNQQPKPDQGQMSRWLADPRNM